MKKINPKTNLSASAESRLKACLYIPEGHPLGIPCPICHRVDTYRHLSMEKRPDGTIYRVKDCLCGNRFATIEKAAENLPITRRGPYNLKKNVT